MRLQVDRTTASVDPVVVEQAAPELGSLVVAQREPLAQLERRCLVRYAHHDQMHTKSLPTPIVETAQVGHRHEPDGEQADQTREASQAVRRPRQPEATRR